MNKNAFGIVLFPALNIINLPVLVIDTGIRSPKQLSSVTSHVLIFIHNVPYKWIILDQA